MANDLEFLEKQNLRSIESLKNLTEEEKEKLRIRVELTNRGTPFTEKDVNDLYLANKVAIEEKRGRRLYRVETLSQEKQRELQQALQLVPASKGIEYIEKTGQIHPEAIPTLSEPQLRTVRQILAELPSRKDAMLSYLKQQNKTNIPSLNIDELKDRLEVLTDLNQPKELIDATQQLIGAREVAAKKSQNIEDYLAGLPSQLRQTTGEFLAGERGRAISAYQEAVPRIEETLNVSGRLFGGGLPTALGASATDISSLLERMQIDLSEQDIQFYADAAYRNQVRKSLESVEDYKTALEQERGKVFTERGEKFQTYQSALNRQLRESLRVDEYERALQTQRAGLERQREEKRISEKSGLFSDIARTGATVVGTALGAPTIPVPREI